MAYNNLSTMKIQVDAGVAWLTLNHPPINLLDGDMAQELDSVTRTLESDNNVRVVVMESAIPEFFISHSGLGRVASGAGGPVLTTPNFRQTQILTERLRNTPKVTIAKVEGIARGGGNEVVIGCDMAFASEKAVFGQPEIGVGVVPGGGSTQRLPSVIGRGKALEVLLAGEDFSAAMAERYGWINRAMSAEELGPFVKNLAHRIANFPPHTVGNIKAAVNQGVLSWLPASLLKEAYQADLSVASDVTRKRVSDGMGEGLETFDGEINLQKIITNLKPGSLQQS